jgi:hypothetical protein
LVMKLTKFVLRHIFRKYLCHRDFLEKHNAENLQNFAQTQPDLEFFLDNSCQNVNADSNPYLSLYGILGSICPRRIDLYACGQIEPAALKPAKISRSKQSVIIKRARKQV